MVNDGPGTTCRRNTAENFSRLSRAHERYRQTTDRQTDRRTGGDIIIANVNVKRPIWCVSTFDALIWYRTGISRCTVYQSITNGIANGINFYSKVDYILKFLKKKNSVCVWEVCR